MDACPPPVSERRASTPTEARVLPGDSAIGEDEVIIEFFGQLRVVDSLPPSGIPRVPSTAAKSSSSSQLFWIRKDLIEQKSFTPADCFPARRSDRFDKQPVRISFAREIRSQGDSKEAYAEVLRASLARLMPASASSILRKSRHCSMKPFCKPGLK